MFWVGGAMAVMPLLFAGILLSAWWYGRRKKRLESSGPVAPAAPAAPVGDGKSQSQNRNPHRNSS